MSYSLESLNTLLLEVQKWNPAKVIANEEFCYLDLGCVDKDNKVILKDHVLPMLGKDAPSRAKQIVKKRDVLVSTVRPNLNGVGMVKEDYKYATASTGYCVLRVKQSLNADYLFYWVRTKAFISDMEAKATGASYPAVSDKIIKESRIPLPTLEEQKKIAAILDAADEYRQKTKALIDKYDQLTQSLFLDMFGDLRKYPKEAMKDAVNFIDYRGKSPNKVDSGIPLLTAKNIKVGYISEEPREYIPVEEYEEWMVRGFPKTDNILFTTEAPLGQAALLPHYEKVAIAQRLICFQPNESLDPNYLLHTILSPLFQAELNRRATGSTAKGIRSKELAKIEIPIPPLIEFSILSKTI